MSTQKMRGAVEKMAATLGIEIQFDPDDALGKFRRGPMLTMGQLRSMEDGAVVWLVVHDDDGSLRADGAYRLERRDDCWMLDDGSSFAADFDDAGEDGDPASDDYSQISEAVPDEYGRMRARILSRLRAVVRPGGDASAADKVGQIVALEKALDELDRLGRTSA